MIKGLLLGGTSSCSNILVSGTWKRRFCIVSMALEHSHLASLSSLNLISFKLLNALRIGY